MSFEINLTVGILDGSIILGERYFQRDVFMVFYVNNSLCALWFQKFYKPGGLESQYLGGRAELETSLVYTVHSRLVRTVTNKQTKKQTDCKTPLGFRLTLIFVCIIKEHV